MSADFAFAAKRGAEVQRTRPNMGVRGAGSDNDDDVPFALAAAADPAIRARFWSHVDRSNPGSCWLWTANRVGHRTKSHPATSRHGQFTYTLNPHAPWGGKNRQHHVYAHRFAWTLAYGLIPPGLHVLHRCDVYPCVNPAHLFLGTQDDNMKDAAQKNRLTVPRTCTLSLYERLMIFRAKAARGICVRLASQYGVSRSAISLIRRGRFIGSGAWHGTKRSA